MFALYYFIHILFLHTFILPFVTHALSLNIIELIFARMDAAIILMGRLSGGTGQFNYSFDETPSLEKQKWKVAMQVTNFNNKMESCNASYLF